MAIVVRKFLDHVLVQFSSGAEHQKAKPGEIEGAHLVEVEYLVDDKTGTVMGQTNNPKNGQAQPLDAAKVSAVIGDKFATVAAQLAETQAKLYTAEGEVSQLNAKIVDLTARIEKLNVA